MRVFGNLPRDARDVLAQGELHSLGGVADDQVAARFAVSQLDHGVLAADRIGRSVQEPSRRCPSRQGTIDRNVVAGDHVLDPHFGHDRQAELIDASLDGDVRMRVDDAGHRDEPCRLDHRDARFRFHVGADGLDDPLLDQD